MTATQHRQSWLVQRLKRPYPQNSILGHDNPFAFGGGKRNGGLSDDAMGLIRGIFSFDYMGAAEFEWGAVPEAMQSIAKNAKRLAAFSFDIPLAQVAPDFRAKDTAPEGSATVYVLCHAQFDLEAQERIREWAGQSYNPDLKESTRLSSALRPHNEWDGDVCGWLELDNGFFFFTDEVMWRATCRLFGVRASGS